DDDDGLERIRSAQAKLARTRLRTTLELAPMGNVTGDLAGILGEHLLDLMGMFHERALCRRANIAVTEFVTNALAYTSDPEAELRVQVTLAAEALVVEVSNKVDDAQYADVE